MPDNKSKRDGRDRSKVSGSENYEIQYFKEKMGVSSQAVAEQSGPLALMTARPWKPI